MKQKSNTKTSLKTVKEYSKQNHLK